MNSDQVKWRVITAGVKRGLFGERKRAREKAEWYWTHGGFAKEDVEVKRHVVKPRAPKCAPVMAGEL